MLYPLNHEGEDQEGERRNDKWLDRENSKQKGDGTKNTLTILIPS